MNTHDEGMIPGIADRRLITLLGEALLQEWPADTRLQHVIACATGCRIDSDETLGDFVARANLNLRSGE